MKYNDAIAPSVRLVDAGDWNSATMMFADASYQQTPAYATLVAARQKARVEHALIEQAGNLLGVATIRIRTIPLTNVGYAYVSGGPLTRLNRGDDASRLFTCMTALKRYYVEQRGLTLRCLLPLGSSDWNASIQEAASARGYEQAEQGRTYQTFLLDINRPLDDIRAGCSKYWRRNLRRGEQRSFSVEHALTPDGLEAICNLYASLQTRKSFRTDLDARFYTEFVNRVGREHIHATLITCEGSPVSGLITSFWGDTCVPLVFATTEHGLRQYAAYVLQWHAIESAHARGMQFYDLGGIDAAENPGVYNFKKGLRGIELTAPGPFEARPVGLAGSIPSLAERALRARQERRQAA